MVAISPEKFLAKLLVSRGYDTTLIPARSTRSGSPSLKQIQDYDTAIVTAVRNSDIFSLKRLHAEGRRWTMLHPLFFKFVH